LVAKKARQKHRAVRLPHQCRQWVATVRSRHPQAEWRTSAWRQRSTAFYFEIKFGPVFRCEPFFFYLLQPPLNFKFKKEKNSIYNLTLLVKS
jgi:hypothetical protein